MNLLKRLSLTGILVSAVLTAYPSADPFSEEQMAEPSIQTETTDSHATEEKTKVKADEQIFAGPDGNRAKDNDRHNANGPAVLLALIGCVLGIGGLAVGVLCMLQIKKSNEAVKKLQKKNDQNIAKLKEFIEIHQNELNRTSVSLRDLDQEVGSFKTMLSKPVAHAAASYSQPQREDPIVSDQVNSYRPAPVETTEQYFGVPNNNTFSGPSAKYVSGKTLYKINDNGSRTASFSFVTNPEAATVAKRSVSRFLECACVIAGDSGDEFSKIVTTTPGTVEREGSGWRIVRKAQVQLMK